MKKKALVETRFYTFADTPGDLFRLETGQEFGPITLAYETYGKLNANRDNAILVFHALTGSQHAAGYNPSVPDVGDLWNDECWTGWWDGFIGPDRALDTNKYFIICANYLGGCYGSTGPMSLNPATGKPYGGDFPIVSTLDVINSQLRLLDHLGIDTLLATIGGSLGGMLALQLAVIYPERVRCIIPIAAGGRVTTLQKLHNFEQIFAVEEDHNFNYGNYYDGPLPVLGLTLARMIGHKSFVSLDEMENRSRKEIVQGVNDLKGYRLQHRIESYILHQAKKFVARFDANAYLRIMNMWQSFCLKTGCKTDIGRAVDVLRNHRALVFSIDSDVCFWPEEQDEICQALKDNNVNYQYVTVHSDKGHDSFLLEPDLYRPHITFILQDAHREISLV